MQIEGTVVSKEKGLAFVRFSDGAERLFDVPEFEVGQTIQAQKFPDPATREELFALLLHFRLIETLPRALGILGTPDGKQILIGQAVPTKNGMGVVAGSDNKEFYVIRPNKQGTLRFEYTESDIEEALELLGAA